jgi:two-component system nitrate/nitrite response regulator NarL
MLADKYELLAPGEAADVVITDASPAEIASVRAAYPHSRLIVLGDKAPGGETLRAMAEGGISAYLRAGVPIEMLMAAIDVVVGSEATIWPNLRPLLRLVRPETAAPPALAIRGRPFSEREIAVIRGLRDGISNKQIGERHQIALSSVKVHVKAVLRKLGINNRTQAAAWASRNLPSTRGTNESAVDQAPSDRGAARDAADSAVANEPLA